jgi:hypothetical protein
VGQRVSTALHIVVRLGGSGVRLPFWAGVLPRRFLITHVCDARAGRVAFGGAVFTGPLDER